LGPVRRPQGRFSISVPANPISKNKRVNADNATPPCLDGKANEKIHFFLIAFQAATRQTKDMAKTPKKAKRTPNAAFMKPVTPDEKLAKVVGDKPLPRTELTKKLWVYIRKNGLQDAKKRTLINADDNLKAVFNGKKQVSMFEMTKLVSGHVKK
jgi:chromatin remodeling complex protein RSC6